MEIREKDYALRRSRFTIVIEPGLEDDLKAKAQIGATRQ
jgi:hypothetical protein